MHTFEFGVAPPLNLYSSLKEDDTQIYIFLIGTLNFFVVISVFKTSAPQKMFNKN